MAYLHDDEARGEALDHKIADDEIARLGDLCNRKAAALGQDGVRGHRVPFVPEAWGTAADCLPSAVRSRRDIRRGDVFDIGAQVTAGDLPAAYLLTASFIWGMGKIGYGPRRHRDILAAAGNGLEASLTRTLKAIREDDGQSDPIAGYAQLYGGCDYDARAEPGDERWSRLHGFGPAFFTKFLYFSTPGALILDARMARVVKQLSNLDHLVGSNGGIPAWTPYRYCVYLHWMEQTAQAAGVQPDMLEVTLFEPPADPPDEGDAAD
jgi:hypothetical protein